MLMTFSPFTAFSTPMYSNDQMCSFSSNCLKLLGVIVNQREQILQCLLFQTFGELCHCSFLHFYSVLKDEHGIPGVEWGVLLSATSTDCSSDGGEYPTRHLQIQGQLHQVHCGGTSSYSGHQQVFKLPAWSFPQEREESWPGNISFQLFTFLSD